jgi:hypothetical protein
MWDLEVLCMGSVRLGGDTKRASANGISIPGWQLLGQSNDWANGSGIFWLAAQSYGLIV